MASTRIPKIIFCGLLAIWLCLGVWIAANAPFGSGTDESIRYVAFAAAKNRWATEEDFHRHHIDHFYYPPLYYLLFAPFWGDDPAFVQDYPQEQPDPNYLNRAGRQVMSAEFLAKVPPPLNRLYRAAKLLSLFLGLIVILALAATLRILFPGPSGWWAVLLGTAPVILLPQFLYYQTLVNNDCLLNALAALAILAFTAAVRAAARGNERRFFALALAVGVCIGLAFLTKMSAPVLLPLLAGLALVRIAADSNLPWKKRIGRVLRLKAALALAFFISGGWWIAYKAAQGDWSSIKAQQVAHPWAKANVGLLADPVWWYAQALQIVRSYYALFSGALFVSVPDLIFASWLLVPIAAAACGIVLLVRRLRNREAPCPADSERRYRRFIWGTFAGIMVLNIASLMLNLLFFLAAYGRLLFPSIVAIHALMAALFARAVRRPRALAAVALGIVTVCGALFGWTAWHRLAPAVLQPPEDVRILTGVRKNVLNKAVWDVSLAQPLLIPSGDLAALRLGIFRVGDLPQAGASIEGSLRIYSAGGGHRDIRLLRTALGDCNVSPDWTELKLEQETRLDTVTEAVLYLRASPPLWPRGLTRFKYNCAGFGMPANVNDALSDCALCVAAVYRRQG